MTGRLPRPQVRPFREMNPRPIGAVFLATLGLLLLLAFNLDRLPFTSGTAYSAAFAQASGLRPGDQVMIGGVPVGKVGAVTLEGTHVKVSFTIARGGVHLGRQTTASIEIATLLGNKYLSLRPEGGGSWPAGRELPLTQTASPYDVEPALQDLTRTVGSIDTGELARALDTMAATFRNSPASLRSMLSGLSRLSQTVAARDAELGSLLRHANAVTGVLAARRHDLVEVFGDGDQLLRMLEERRAVVDSLFANTAAMAQQLTGLVHDNQSSLRPALERLHGVLTVLNDNQANLDQIVKELYVFVRGEVDATGSGPWFDGTAINFTNPFQAGHGQPTLSTSHPRTLGDLLGVPR